MPERESLPPAAGSDRGSLAGLRVVVTRPRHQAAPTVAAFRAAGARVELLPLVEVVPPEDPRPLDRALVRLETYDWIVFTSANAVQRFFTALAGHAARLPSGARLAVIGKATAEALRARGSTPAVEASDSRAEGLLDALGPHLEPGASVLLPQAADARLTLEEGLRALGARPERVDAYAKRRPPDSRRRAEEIFGASRLGWVTFTSPSIARAFAGLWGELWEARRGGLLAASIGPVTSEALVALGVEPAAEAVRPGDDELVAAVAAAVAAGP